MCCAHLPVRRASMEYRCRLGTPGGEIIEGIYVAETKRACGASSRRRGCTCSASSAPGRSGLGDRWKASAAQAPAHSAREFLVFNQELATLLKAGMPLVQSLDILRRARHESGLQVRARRRARAGCGAAARCRSVRGAGLVFPGIYTASLLAGEKSGSLEQVIRRYVAYVKVVSAVKRKTISALVYPGDPACCSRSSSSRIIVLQVVPEFGVVLQGQFGAELPLSTRVIVGDLELCRRAISRCSMLDDRWRRSFALLGVVRQPGNRVRFDSWMLRIPMLGRHLAAVRDLAGGAHAGDAARRRHSAGERDRHRVAVDLEPVHRDASSRSPGSRCAKGARCRRR